MDLFVAFGVGVAVTCVKYISYPLHGHIRRGDEIGSAVARALVGV